MAHLYIQVPTGRLVRCPTPSCPSVSSIPVLKRHVKRVHAPADVLFVCRLCPDFRVADARKSTGHLRAEHGLRHEDPDLAVTLASWSLADVIAAAPQAPGGLATIQTAAPCGLPIGGLQAQGSPPPTSPPGAAALLPAVPCGLPATVLQAPSPLPPSSQSSPWGARQKQSPGAVAAADGVRAPSKKPSGRGAALDAPVMAYLNSAGPLPGQVDPTTSLPSTSKQGSAPCVSPLAGPSSPSPPRGPLLRTPGSAAAAGSRLLHAGRVCRGRVPPALWRTTPQRLAAPRSPPQIVAAAAISTATTPRGRPWEEVAAELSRPATTTPSSPWDPMACHDPGAVAEALGVRVLSTMPSGGDTVLHAPGLAMIHSADAAPRQVAPVFSNHSSVKDSSLPSSHSTGTAAAPGPSASPHLTPRPQSIFAVREPRRVLTPPISASSASSASPATPPLPTAPVRPPPISSPKDLFACIVSPAPSQSGSPRGPRANAFQRRWIRKLQEAEDWAAFELAVEGLTSDLLPPAKNRGHQGRGRGRGGGRRPQNAARRLQFLYKVNKKRAMREVREEDSPLCSLPPEEVESFFERVFAARLPHLEDPPVSAVLPPTLPEDVRLVAPITRENIMDRLRRCANTAPGPDGVPYASLKRKDSGCHILAEVFKICMSFKRIPASWKTAKTVLIYKKGEMTDLSNWRPIALSSCLYKLYTAVLADRLSTWALRTGALSSIQKGFVPAEGCLEHNFLLQQCLDYARESGSELCVSWLDLKNAFGSVPHSAILALLRQHGVHQDFVDIVEEAYSNSSTTIVTSSGETRAIPMASGVKQGDPLSPIIFNLFIEVILRSVLAIAPLYGFQLHDKTLSCLAFADDIVLLGKSRQAIHMHHPRTWKNRHSSVIKNLVEAMDDSTREQLRIEKAVPGSATRLLPDLVLLDEEKKQATIIDIACPFENRSLALMKKREEKCMKYEPICEELRASGYSATCDAVVVGDQLYRRIREGLQHKHLINLTVKPDQGRVFECVARDPSSSHFIYSGNRTRFCDWRFIFRARLGVLPLNAALRIPDRNRSCRRCGHELETTLHVLNNCLGSSSMHHPRTWKNRHSSVIKNLVEAMDDTTKQQLRIEKAVPGSATRLLPDLVLLDEQKKQATIIDIACPFENRWSRDLYVEHMSGHRQYSKDVELT
ncbi:hypothetical protein FOCC_FOCC014242 [Frankliniella occidentalis]|nr:hypothetical protein FOCC_FOCC014242 [Frankliniella occidentalis]